VYFDGHLKASKLVMWIFRAGAVQKDVFCFTDAFVVDGRFSFAAWPKLAVPAVKDTKKSKLF
jgi:hypothetical protein